MLGECVGHLALINLVQNSEMIIVICPYNKASTVLQDVSR